jgi:hypothetical protein
MAAAGRRRSPSTRTSSSSRTASPRTSWLHCSGLLRRRPLPTAGRA